MLFPIDFLNIKTNLSNYSALMDSCIQLQAVCGWNVEQLKSLFLAGYTLQPPEQILGGNLDEL